MELNTQKLIPALLTMLGSNLRSTSSRYPKMLRFKYNLEWSYVDVYCDDTKIGTVNYIMSENDAYLAAKQMYENYIEKNKEF